jgi:uncharacterized protein (TIGR02118 family)
VGIAKQPQHDSEDGTMFLMFARFDFKSTDLAAEDKNYFDHHVALARQLPGVRMYLTGKLLETAQGKPDHYRAVVFGYDTAEAGLTSLDCPAGAELMADSAEHIVGTTVAACEGEVIVPFDARRPGERCLVVALLYNLAAHADEARMRSYRNSIRDQPGLCGYMAGPTFEARGEKSERDRMEIRIVRPDALREKSRRDLASADDLMRSPLVYCFEGEVQI